MYAQRVTLSVVTDADGNATAYTPLVSFGALSTVRYAKEDYANGVDFTITLESTGETVWAESNVDAAATKAPRQATHTTAGVAAVYAVGGAAVLAPIVVVNDRFKVVIAEGGDTREGIFHFVLT